MTSRKSTDRFTYGDLTDIPEIAYGYGVGNGTLEAQAKTKTQSKGQSDTKLEKRVRRLESDMRGVTTLIHNQNKVIEDMVSVQNKEQQNELIDLPW